MTYDPNVEWMDAVKRLIHDPQGDARLVARDWVRLLGPAHAAPADCRWRPGGFERYLDELIL